VEYFFHQNKLNNPKTVIHFYIFGVKANNIFESFCCLICLITKQIQNVFPERESLISKFKFSGKVDEKLD
jgi:hypothetical protein